MGDENAYLCFLSGIVVQSVSISCLDKVCMKSYDRRESLSFKTCEKTVCIVKASPHTTVSGNNDMKTFTGSCLLLWIRTLIQQGVDRLEIRRQEEEFFLRRRK